MSEDIFYQVKKEILDKLDIILQKINLEIINYLHPQEEEFSFIELSSFEHEITHLFNYLDRLYASLNSSVSFSSNHSKASLDYHAENQRLSAENQNLHNLLLGLQQQHQLMLEEHQLTLEEHQHVFHEQQRSLEQLRSQEITFDKQITSQNSLNLEELRDNVRGLMLEFKAVGKDVKKMLKKYKFELLESRVEIISRLKDFEVEQAHR